MLQRPAASGEEREQREGHRPFDLMRKRRRRRQRFAGDGLGEEKRRKKS